MLFLVLAPCTELVHVRTMSTANEIVRRLGDGAVEKIATRIRVSPRTVQNKLPGQFPAAWWFGINSLCNEHGVECPPDAFTFREAAE